ncbi:hypothetical protein ANCCEY_08516 [Ancylostoma ceylanicum]|uniref:Peptidase aspartic putative domain-containing protein n=1 Tax=Ancylostoma ceylanicum TaxID=53326 RepID=A0A0D6LMH7_9BILA|nr:hypothetical protein ANCCEY_08516 [Ancylostoma ceylanicum]
MIVRTRIFNEASKEFEIVHALLDSAANQSFMASALADRMQLDYHSETTITVTKFGGRAAKKRVKRVTANLFNANGEKMAMEFYTQERIIPPLHLNELSPADKRALNEIFPEVEEIVDRQNITPELLIGIDYFNYVMQLDVPSIRLPSGIFVTSTFFGPVISGLPRHCMEDPENVRLCERVLHAYVTQAQLDFTQDYSDLWKLPNVGIDELGTNEEENDRIVKEFYDSVELKDEEIYEELNRNLYVDDVLMTDTSTASLFHKYRACKKIFSNISMNLRQFMTSDPICNQMIDSKDLTNGKNIKTLGIQWNPVQDELQIRCTLQYDEEPTKRKVLQAVHSTFDPLGYLTSLLLPATIFLQDLWNLKYSWDDPLSTKDSSTWRTICENAAGSIDSHGVTDDGQTAARPNKTEV